MLHFLHLVIETAYHNACLAAAFPFHSGRHDNVKWAFMFGFDGDFQGLSI